ncbi:hypothetical protein PGT21_029002 [Puccinia graminis f. sp. tritici]|uniref:Cyclin-like F-box n=3 Tax=Puccinia graminis f. sp. tritici TaxID=56615 RepID=A0A5B0NMI5_PUCGR|nr:hypothetical protein PGT21_029002 [Puccinia graminis f. sp. tritici]
MIRISFLWTLFLLAFLSKTSQSRAFLNRRQRGAGGASPTFKINSEQAVAQAQLAQTKGVVAGQASNEKIVPMTAEIGGFAIQFKVSGDPSDLQPAAKNGAVIRATETTAGDAAAGKGINLLLHGDGGQSFFDFPNKGDQVGLLGVVALAPNDKMFWGGGGGNQRTDGVLHSKLLDALITNVLPQVIKMDSSKVFFMGISGGSFLLAGFFLPAFAEKYQSGAILGCGALPPQVQPSANFGKTLETMRIHFQTSAQEQDGIQVTIPQAIVSYLKAATDAQVDKKALAKKLTADATPKGTHCVFDGKQFVSGIQLLTDNYSRVIFGDGDIKGIGKVSTSAADNNQKFASGVPVAKLRNNAAGGVPQGSQLRTAAKGFPQGTQLRSAAGVFPQGTQLRSAAGVFPQSPQLRNAAVFK